MIELRNPFIFAPIKLGYCTRDGYVNDKHINFYTKRSNYLGAVTLEPLYIDKGLREIPTQLGIDDDDKIEGLQKLVETIHESGAKVIAHLNHPGRMANPKIPNNYFVSSTDKPCENGGAAPKRMTREDMDKVINLFVDAAIRAQKANFDFIELQYGHGYLFAQFISAFINDRADEYGGDFENRIKFPLEVLQAVKKAVDLPIIVRISGDEIIPNGIKLPEMIEFSKILEQNGVDAIHVSAGSICSTPPWFFQHMFIPKGKTWELAKKIKENINIPVIFVGRINSFEDIENLKNEYSADYIAVGRALVADPNFIGKYLGNEEGVVRPCLACAAGCLGGVKSGQGLQCLANPEVGMKTEPLEVAKEPKQYAVVGGGLAGMEAALTLKRKGHNVDLYEKNRLGGQFNLAALPIGKNSLSLLVDYYKKALEHYVINIFYQEAGSNELLSKNYDGVVIATGSKPFVPPVPGLDKYMWAEVLEKDNMVTNSKVVIIGGGLIGIEVAHNLVENNNEVVIIEMLSEIARGMEMIEKTITLNSFKNKPVKIYTDTKVTKVEGDKVYVEGKKNGTITGVDYIIVTAGMKSYNPLEGALSGKIPVYVIGDAKQVGNAQTAIRDAYEVAKKL